MQTPMPASRDLKSLLDTASSAIFQILPQPHSEKFEHYSITSHKLAKLSIYLSESDPFTVHRRSQDIEDDSAFDFLVVVQLQGSAEIEQEVNRAREHLRGQVAALVVSGAGQILKKEIDASANDELLKDLVSQI